MKDGLDVVQDVRSLINIPVVTDEIDGEIWPDERPAGSTKIDIVVNSLGITNDWLQEGISNVNVYAPNLTRTIDGAIYSFPNHTELNRICKLITPLMETQDRFDFRTEIRDPGTLLQDTDGSWFISIQLNYYSMQTNFKNI